jgi:hypothetical protein
MIDDFIADTATRLGKDVSTVREVAGIVVRLLEEKLGTETVAAVDQKVAGLSMLSASVGGGGAGLSALGSGFTGNFGEKGGLILMADRYDIDRQLLRGVSEGLLHYIETNGAPTAAHQFRTALPDLDQL